MWMVFEFCVWNISWIIYVLVKVVQVWTFAHLFYSNRHSCIGFSFSTMWTPVNFDVYSLISANAAYSFKYRSTLIYLPLVNPPSLQKNHHHCNLLVKLPFHQFLKHSVPTYLLFVSQPDLHILVLRRLSKQWTVSQHSVSFAVTCVYVLYNCYVKYVRKVIYCIECSPGFCWTGLCAIGLNKYHLCQMPAFINLPNSLICHIFQTTIIMADKQEWVNECV